MNILIMHQTVASHDAIGNDIELMYKILIKKHTCYIYADNQFNSEVTYASEEQVKNILDDKKSLILYHHSVFWEKGEKLLRLAKGLVVFRYHNITPPEFFEPYNEFAFQQCAKGREQTVTFMRDFTHAYWMSDSDFNTKDLINVPIEHISVCAPFHKIAEWTKIVPDEKVLKLLLENNIVNLLFVGRIAPNKGHLLLLEILRLYLLNYDNKIKLRIIGKFDSGIKGYNDIINKKIKEYKLHNNVEFVGEINDATLAAYYLGSDIFMCVSEHEGFCVPILEAQSFGLPVISLDCCAVSFTGGKGQILLERDPRKFAAAIKVLKRNDDAYQYLQKEGLNNYRSNYLYEHLQSVFEKQIAFYEEVIS